MTEETYRNKKAASYVDPFTRKYEHYKPVYEDLLTRKYEPYKPVYVDPLTRKYEPFKFVYVDPLTKTYPSFKPKFVGIYGEKPRQRRSRPQEPPKKTTKKTRIKIKTFQCYRFPMGPDIRVGKIGPDYRNRSYEEIKFRTLTPLKFHRVYNDPLSGSKIEVYKPTEIPKTRTVDYKLTEENYLPFRYWKIGDVTDTVALGPDLTPKTNRMKYKKDTASSILQHPKTNVTSSTQYVIPLTKNTATQTDISRSRVSGTQTTPLPSVSLVPGVEARKLKKTTGTQYSPPETPITSSISKKDNRTSNPTVPLLVAHTGSRPKVSNEIQTAEYIGFQNDRRKTALPPEINAYIEAYDVVRMVDMAEDVISSIKRTLRLV